jgi:hypothetical protein
VATRRPLADERERVRGAGSHLSKRKKGPLAHPYTTVRQRDLSDSINMMGIPAPQGRFAYFRNRRLSRKKVGARLATRAFCS